MSEFQLHPNTQKLLDRMIAIGNRQDFYVNKEKAEKCLTKIYQLHNLKAPSYEWVDDICDKKLLDTSRASEASWASRASWASGASGVSVDYDFDYFLNVFDWIQKNPDKGDNNDKKFIQSMYLFLEVKENGAGFFAEFEGKGFIAPRCVVRLNEQYKHHSETLPAIEFEKGFKAYFLHGVKFEKDLWQSIVDRTIKPKDVVAMSNTEQKMATMKTIGMEKIFDLLDAKLISTSKTGTEWLYLIENVFSQPEYFLKKKDWSTDRLYFECVDFELGDKKTADNALKWQFNVSLDVYNTLKVRT